MKRTGAVFLPRLSPSSTKSFKMALACVRTTKTLPFLVSTARVELTRSISKMARSCKAGRNKRREVKVGLKFSIQIALHTCSDQNLHYCFPFFLNGTYFSARLDFPSSPLPAPGSPRMMFHWEILLWMSFKTFFVQSRVVSPTLIPKPWGLLGDTFEGWQPPEI